MKSNKQRILDELKHQANKQGFEFSNYNRVTSTDDHRVCKAHKEVERTSPTLYGPTFQADALGVSPSLVQNRIQRAKKQVHDKRKH